MSETDPEWGRAMTKWWNKGLCVLASAVLALGLFASQVYAATKVGGDAATQYQTVVPGAAEDDADLIAGYIEQRLEAELPKTDEPVLLRSRRNNNLSGNDATIYALLKTMITEVAAGERSSTEFVITITDLLGQNLWTAEELGVEAIFENGSMTQAARDAVNAKLEYDFSLVLDALMSNCPYELYWYDKTSPTGWSTPGAIYTYSGGQYLAGFSNSAKLVFRLPVSVNYAVNGQAGTYVVDTATGARVTTAVETAKGIAAGGEELSAYDRLAYFKEQICDLTAYNDAAAADDDMPYGDPWQLIYVFDGDVSTNVVCEGYSKAFQYLCDLAGIPGVECYCVTGTMVGGTGAGAHMWNLVNMDDGLVYLVDVTNCDTGTIGSPSALFIVPFESGNVNDGYVFRAYGSAITYVYDSFLFNTFTVDELTVSGEGYVSPSELPASEGWTKLGSCEYRVEGDTYTIRPIGNGTSGVLPNTGGSSLPASGSDPSMIPGASDESVKHVVFESGVKANSDLSGAFYNCSNLESIDFGDFDTSATTNMRSMFAHCTSLTELDVSGFDTSKVQNMTFMFMECSALTSLDLTAFDTSNVEGEASNGTKTGMAAMFEDCSSLVELDVSSFNTSKVRDMSQMFSNCSALESINVSGFDTSKVHDMSDMFSCCESLKLLDISNFDTSSVEGDGSSIWHSGMGSMFYRCSSLTSLDLSNFDTSKVQNMSFMFSDCSALSELDLSSFDTSSVTGAGDADFGSGMTGMFMNCTSLTTLDLSGFDTSNVSDMTLIFDGCSSLQYLDISGFDTSNVTDMSFVFTGCSSLQTFIVGDRFVQPATDGLWSAPDGDWIAESNGRFYYGSELAHRGVADTYTLADPELFEPTEGWSQYGTCECKVNGDTLTIRPIASMRYGKLLNTDTNPIPYVNNSAVTCVVFESGVIANVHLDKAFYGCTNLESIDLSGLDASLAVDMGYMFSGCSSLTSINLEGLDTSTMTNMFEMFYGCSSLVSLDLSDLDTSHVSNMNWAFAECTALTSLNLSNLDTSNLIIMSNMVNGCSSLVSLDLSDWDTSNVLLMANVFDGCSSLRTLIVGESFVQPTDEDRWSAPAGEWIAASDGKTYSGYELAHRGVADTYTRAHVYSAVAEVPATCTEPGLAAHFKCDECGKLFVLEGGNYFEATEDELVIPALGHDWDEGVITTTPTCEATGVRTLTCKNDASHTNTEVIPATGHSYKFVAEVPATCTKAGVAEHFECSTCGKLFVLEGDEYYPIASAKLVIPALDHDWDEGVITTAPTCETEGVCTYTCKNDASHTKTEAIPATGHSYKSVAEVPATCTKAGTAAHYKCSDCGKLFVLEGGAYIETSLDKLAIPALGHTWDEGVVTKPATETTEGVMTFTCTVCGETRTETIPTTDHNYVFVAEVPATCTEAGTAAHYKCSNCGKLFILKDGAYVETTLEKLAIPALGHTWDEGVVTTPATETTEGVMTFTCTVCGETRTEAIPTTDHTYVFVAEVPATCTKAGTAAHYKCSECGKLFVLEGGAYIETTLDKLAIPATGHTWDEGVVTKPATETTEGVMTFTCTVCGETRTEAIPTTDHTYVFVAEVPATCTKAGTAAHYKCDECGKLFVLEGGNYFETSLDKLTIPALGHDWDEGTVTTAPTCETDGVRTFTCKNDASHTKTEAIPALGHIYGDWTVTKEATCTEAGSREKTCSACGDKVVEEIAALGHTWDEGVVTTPATTTAEGVMTYTCTTCGETRTEAIPKLTPAHEPGWAKENGGWYYYEEDGTLRTGEWIQALGNWYYLGADGKLVINGWSEWQGKYYYMGANGKVMKEGWAEWQGKYYYVKNYQVMKEGWVLYNGKYFYIRSYLPVVNDWVNYDGKWYHFNASGVCDRVA